MHLAHFKLDISIMAQLVLDVTYSLVFGIKSNRVFPPEDTITWCCFGACGRNSQRLAGSSARGPQPVNPMKTWGGEGLKFHRKLSLYYKLSIKYWRPYRANTNLDLC